MTTSTLGLLAGLLLAIAFAAGGFTALLFAVVLGAAGYLIGAHRDGEIDLAALACGDADVASAAQTPADVDAGSRGSLTVHDKVVERLVSRAALKTAGVEHHSGGLDKLTGRDLPRVRVHVTGDRVRAGLDVAVAWSSSLPAVAAAVQRNVTDALTTWAGLRVDAVDVAVVSVLTDVAGKHPGRRVQ